MGRMMENAAGVVAMRTVTELEEALARPSTALVEELAAIDGDIVVLGSAGKMGPSLVRLAHNAVALSGTSQGKAKQVVAVSRFSQAGVRAELDALGVRTIAADLLEEGALESLPDAANVIYMAGTKFGTSGSEHLTWAQNAFLPGLVGRRYRDSRIVAFSTGNVYPFTPVASVGSRESDPTGPVGEYAQSCLGRERLFEHASRGYGTPVVLFRLNYALDLRYGILLEVAQAVKDGRSIDVTMGHVNVIWQGDANEYALRSLRLCSSPPTILNVTGPETISVRWLAQRFGELLAREPRIVGNEADNALLSNAGKGHELFGAPRVSLDQMIEWTAAWVKADGETLGKPTHFATRDGRF
jgi:nucleoside-diphosphate-sugar epimerase